jgi:hypothetical protein
MHVHLKLRHKRNQGFAQVCYPAAKLNDLLLHSLVKTCDRLGQVTVWLAFAFATTPIHATRLSARISSSAASPGIIDVLLVLVLVMVDWCW